MMKKKKAVIITVALAVAITVTIATVVSISSKDHNYDESQNNDSLNSYTNSIEENSQENAPEHIDTVPDGYIGIYTADDFDYLRNSSTGNYILMRDIDMNSIEKWEGINFQGQFNGNNYKITNYHFKNGLFDTLTDATITNLELSVNMKETTTIRDDGSWTQGIGALANCIKTSNSSSSSSLISDCKITGSIIASSSDVGAVAGNVLPGNANATITILNVVNEANITYNGSEADCGIGGIIGKVSQQNASDDDFTALEINHTVNRGNIILTGDGYKSGGIIGYGCGSIDNCDNFGNITVTCGLPKDGDPIDSLSSLDGTYKRKNNICGGIIGSNGYCTYEYGEIRFGSGEIGYLNSCANYGNINSKNSEYTGGIIGYTTVGYNLFDCINFANINSMNSGGIQGGGYVLSEISHCVNIGKINGSNSSGALIGEFSSNAPEPQNCYYLNNGINSVGVKAAFPNVHMFEESQLSNASYFDSLNGDIWTFGNNGPKLISTDENEDLYN